MLIPKYFQLLNCPSIYPGLFSISVEDSTQQMSDYISYVALLLVGAYLARP